MRKLATYLVAFLVFVAAFFAVKITLTLMFGTLVRTAVLALGALAAVGVAAVALNRRR